MVVDVFAMGYGILGQARVAWVEKGTFGVGWGGPTGEIHYPLSRANGGFRSTLPTLLGLNQIHLFAVKKNQCVIK